jgi:GAF domain-containing protein
MIDPEQASRLPGIAHELIAHAQSPDIAMRALARLLRSHFSDLVRVSLRVLRPDREAVLLAGVWSDRPTKLQTGATLAVTATATPEVLASRQPVFGRAVEAETPVDQILAEEGIRSWVSIPLRAGAVIVGTVTLSSSRTDAFSPDDEPFLTALIEAIEVPLVALVPHRTD